jgi:hypothetical protein
MPRDAKYYCSIVEAARRRQAPKPVQEVCSRSVLYLLVMVHLPLFSSRHLFRISSIWREEIGNRNRLVAHTRGQGGRRRTSFNHCMQSWELDVHGLNDEHDPMVGAAVVVDNLGQLFFGGSIRQQRLSSIRRHHHHRPSTLYCGCGTGRHRRKSKMYSYRYAR